MKDELQSAKRAFYAAIAGTVVVAICCFTPLLIILLIGVGLSAFTPYLDYVLFPALAILIILTGISYRRWKRLKDGKK